ncbi:hypothetical protein [Alteribacillus sp. HJP-4]|uniref:hypothetical protein n=1 Tax=Alteribacillus sp. HJP-4 TaxID=2775394 RepID=UPI0035CCCED6
MDQNSITFRQMLTMAAVMTGKTDEEVLDMNGEFQKQMKNAKQRQHIRPIK